MACYFHNRIFCFATLFGGILFTQFPKFFCNHSLKSDRKLLFRSLVDFGSFIRLNLKENQFTGGIEVFDDKELPILAMTASAMASDRDKAISAGMNDHISKPIEI